MADTRGPQPRDSSSTLSHGVENCKSLYVSSLPELIDLALLHLLPRPRLQLAPSHQRGLRDSRWTPARDDSVIFPDLNRLLVRGDGRLSRVILLRAASATGRGLWRSLRLHQRSLGFTHPKLGGGFSHSSTEAQVRSRSKETITLRS